MKVIFVCIMSILACGCQSLYEYHDSLITTSLASEIPTLLGNCAGAVVGVPFLAISIPISQFTSDATEMDTQEKKTEKISAPSSQSEIMLWPIKVSSYTGGILLGTPFYWPLATECFRRENIPKHLAKGSN